MDEKELMVALLMKCYFKGEKNIEKALEESFSEVDKMDEFIDENDIFFKNMCNIQAKIIILENTILSGKILKNRKDYKYIIRKLEEVTEELKKCYEEEIENECK